MMENLNNLKHQFLEHFSHGRASEAIALVHSHGALAAWAADNLMKPSRQDPLAEAFLEFLTRTNAEASMVLVDALKTKEGDRVLELGFGAGVALIHAAQTLQSVGGGFLAGMDLSTDCVSAARTALDDVGLGDAVQTDLHQGTASSLPYPNASFDTIYHINCWYFWPDLEAGLQECARVLRPGGTMLTGSKLAGMRALFGQRLDEVKPTSFRNTDLDVYETLATKAGFVDITSAAYNQEATLNTAKFTLTKSTRAP